MQFPVLRPFWAATIAAWLAVWVCLPGITVYLHSDGTTCQTCPLETPLAKSSIAKSSIAKSSIAGDSLDCCAEELSAPKPLSCRSCCEAQNSNSPDFSAWAAFISPDARPEIVAAAFAISPAFALNNRSIAPRFSRGPPPSRGPPAMNFS